MKLERVVALTTDLGVTAGHQLVLLSLEVYDDWADLRFARIDRGADRPLPRRIPADHAWSITGSDAQVFEIVDAVGRGDRSFSNGEVRFRPAPEAGTTLSVTVRLTPDAPSLSATITA